MDHTGVRPHPCEQCKLTFKTSNSLKKHKLSVHSDIKHFPCQHCGSRFSTSSGVLRHQKKQRCSAMKQGIGDTAIKTEKVPLHNTQPELIQFIGNQTKPQPSSEVQHEDSVTKHSKTRGELGQYQAGAGTVLQYLGTPVKTEGGAGRDGRHREGGGEDTVPSLQSLHYLQSLQQPLALTLPRQAGQLDQGSDRHQGSYRLHMP